MSESADPLDRDDVTGTRTGIAQRVVNRHARAHERPRFFRWQFVGNRSQRGRWCDDILSIAAIEIDAGDFAIAAHRKIAAAALLTDKIMPAVPTDANALPFFPTCDAAANCIDMSCDFVAWHARILQAGPQTLLDQRVTVANAARFDFHAHLSGSWLRNVAFN